MPALKLIPDAFSPVPIDLPRLLVDTEETLLSLLEDIDDCKNYKILWAKHCLYIDLEGDKLSRHGTLDILQMFMQWRRQVYLIDVHTLKHAAFDTTSPSGTNLREILEGTRFYKMFFDVRKDSDALFGLYKIKLSGVQDIQLLEYASRREQSRYLYGLAKCIEVDGRFKDDDDKQKWQHTKFLGRMLLDPSCGGSFAIFKNRPLSPEIIEYCAQDVTVMPDLYYIYLLRIPSKMRGPVGEEVKSRIYQSQQQYFNGDGPHMALGPSSLDRTLLGIDFDPPSPEKFRRRGRASGRVNRRNNLGHQATPKDQPGSQNGKAVSGQTNDGAVQNMKPAFEKGKAVAGQKAHVAPQTKTTVQKTETGLVTEVLDSFQLEQGEWAQSRPDDAGII